ncbi:hypothetical protein R83H12_01955 [Fibrobacteria bacterium R8-3-H12]
MRTQFSKLALAATLWLAITFTLSCSSGDDDGEQGSSFNENSQIYYGWDEDDKNGNCCIYHIGEAYKGSGDIKIRIYNKSDNEILINAGRVTDGIINLNLPKTIPDEYLKDFSEEYPGCPNIKIFWEEFVLINGDGNIDRLSIFYEDEVRESISYMYLPKAGKITCNYHNIFINIDAKTGWNKTYMHMNLNIDGSKSAAEISTNNILTKEMKWTIEEKR